MCSTKSRQIYVWLWAFLLLIVFAGTGCHRSQDGSSSVARKAKRAHAPSRAAHAGDEAAPSHPGTATAGETNAGGTSMPDAGSTMGGTTTSGGSSGDGGQPATGARDIFGRKSGGGGPGLHAKPPGGEQQQQTQTTNTDMSSGPAKKGARKAHETLVSETASMDPDQVLQNAVDSLPVGQVAFNHPNEMKMGEAREVQVRISRDVAADISSGLTPTGTGAKDQITEHQQIKVSTSMKVQLHGEPYFDIKPLTDEEQLISKTGFTEWKFTVIPLQGGKWPLHLTVTAVVHAADREKVKNLEVLDEQVTVQVSTLEVVESFVGNNWQWLIGTIFVPIGAWLLPKFRKKKTQAQAA
jgi:hypothetical protein